MDKKSSNRSAQLQSRASAIDSKKNPESTHKPWPQSNKKREGAGSAPKNELYRRNIPAQRGRGQVDRRPHPPGLTGLSVGGTQNTGVEDNEELEFGSDFVSRSKKQNLNHLLNFMYPSHGNKERTARRALQSYKRPIPQRMNHRHQHDLYLRAYCQFVVKEGGDYKINLLDPDIPVKWEQIEEIVVRGTGRSECPICMGLPVAGRVGHCGHVYCWACVLHYAAVHEKQPPPCPVCSTSLQVKDMKPTKIVQWTSSSEEVTMRLVRRFRGSTTVEMAPPRGQYNNISETPILPLEQINNAPFCKLFEANKREVHDILKRERREIESQILNEIDTTEIVFLEQALAMLKLKEQDINMQCDEIKILEETNKEEAPIVFQKQEINDDKLDWFNVTEDGAACVEIINDQIDELKIIDSNQNPEAVFFSMDEVDNKLNDMSIPEVDLIENDKLNQAKYFYFYQAMDGQQVFLNSLNVRILNASWGALPAAPLTIKGRVLNRETIPLSEQTRKHMPYTAHLPLYCSFDVVELDLQPPFVTSEALESFKDELYRRAMIRARNDREERRRERAYRRAMEGPPKPDITSDLLFPPASTSLSLSSSQDPPLTSEHNNTTSSFGSPPLSGPSFAKMASTSGTWRVRKAAPPPPPPPVEDDTTPRSLNLSDAIEAALQATPSPSTKKNKKSKQKLLFTTGLQRAA